MEVSILIDPCISWTRRSDESLPLVLKPPAQLKEEIDEDAGEQREGAPLGFDLSDVEMEDVDLVFFFFEGPKLAFENWKEVVDVFTEDAGGSPKLRVMVSSSDVSLRLDVRADMRVESPSLSTSIASLLAPPS